jgi:hypothetical protein
MCAAPLKLTLAEPTSNDRKPAIALSGPAGVVGALVRYTAHGLGEVLVLMPAGPGLATETIIDELAADARVIAATESTVTTEFGVFGITVTVGAQSGPQATANAPKADAGASSLIARAASPLDTDPDDANLKGASK